MTMALLWFSSADSQTSGDEIGAGSRPTTGRRPPHCGGAPAPMANRT
jgi:hypothetical protein